MKFEISTAHAINALTIMLAILLLIYPSWLVWQEAHFISRILVIICITLGIYIYRKGLIQSYDNVNVIFKLDPIDIIVILGIGFIKYLSLQPFRNGQYSMIGDEYGHSVGAVFGFNGYVNEYNKYIILFIFVSVIIAIITYKYLPHFFKYNYLLCFFVFIAFIELICVEIFSIDKNVAGVYRYPGLGKMFSALVYTYTGINEFTFRIPNHIIYTLLFAILYLFMKHLGSTTLLAILGSLAIVSSPLIRFYSGLQYLEIIWAINYILACFALYKSENNKRDIYLVLFILFSILSFYTRNVSLVLIIVLITLFPIIRLEPKNRRLISEKKNISILFYFSAPMLLWHTLYLVNKYYTSVVMQSAWYFREYTFDIDLLAYINGISNYFSTLSESFNIVLIAMFLISLLYVTINYRNLFVHKYLIISLFGFIVLLLGDVEGRGVYSGYGRFLLMPIAPLIVMYMIYLSNIKQKTLLAINHSALFVIVILNIINYSNNIEIYNDKFKEPNFFIKKDYTSLISQLKNNESQLIINNYATDLHQTLRIIDRKYKIYKNNILQNNNSELDTLYCGNPRMDIKSEKVYVLRKNYNCILLEIK